MGRGLLAANMGNGLDDAKEGGDSRTPLEKVGGERSFVDKERMKVAESSV